MAVKDVAKTVHYYVENFGFNLVMAVSKDKSSIGAELVEGKEYMWANVMHGDVGFMFQSLDSIKEDVGDFFDDLGASATFYIELEDVDAFFEKVKESVDILKPISDTWYGAREFYARDINGYILAFSQMLEQKQQ